MAAWQFRVREAPTGKRDPVPSRHNANTPRSPRKKGCVLSLVRSLVHSFSTSPYVRIFRKRSNVYTSPLERRCFGSDSLQTRREVDRVIFGLNRMVEVSFIMIKSTSRSSVLGNRRNSRRDRSFGIVPPASLRPI